MKRFLIIGGDSRQDYLQQYLENDGFPVMRYRGQEQAQPSLADAMEQANVILSPLPFTKNGTERFSAAEGEALPILSEKGSHPVWRKYPGPGEKPLPDRRHPCL